MENLAKNLSSWRLLAAMIGFVVGLVMALGPNENVVGTAASAVVIGMSAITYIVTKDKIGTAAISKPTETSGDAAENNTETWHLPDSGLFDTLDTGGEFFNE